MPKWLSVVIVIIVFFTVAAIFERWRVKGMDAWCRARGFTPIDPFVPADHPPIPQLVSQITGRDDGLTRRYASATTAAAGDARLTLVEFEYTPRGRKNSAWFTLAVWPASPVSQPLVLAPGSTVPQQAWMTEKRRHALAAWDHGGEFVLADGYAGWVTEGLLTPSRADQLLNQLAEARRVIE